MFYSGVLFAHIEGGGESFAYVFVCFFSLSCSVKTINDNLEMIWAASFFFCVLWAREGGGGKLELSNSKATKTNLPTCQKSLTRYVIPVF